MKFLGIDYGKKKIGLAVSDGMLAEPYLVLKVKNETDLVNKLKHIVETIGCEYVIVGVSEGQMAKEIEVFTKKLQNNISQKIILQDETLSTKDAQRLSLEGGKKRKKRREMEDAYAATVMLQSYLDL